MLLLDFGKKGGSPLGSKKPLKLILGIGVLAGVIALGSTFAANINLNTGNPVEFGQGIAQATACDDRIVVTPQAPFRNDTEESVFTFNQFSVTDISDSCFGKIFTIRVYKNGQNSPLDFYDTNGTIYREILVRDDSGSFSFDGGGLTSVDIQNITGGFRVTIGTGTLPSFSLVSGTDVDRITIESSDIKPDGTRSHPGVSASQIKKDYPQSQSGWYWVTNTNIESGAPVRIYADMSDETGPWTLVLANGDRTDWTPSELLRNQSIELSPPGISNNWADIGVKYSILEWADFLKKKVGDNQLEIRITAPASNWPDFSGIWRAPFATTFTGADTQLVPLIRGVTTNGSVENFMPYLTTSGTHGASKNSLTMCNGGCWWSTLAASAGYGAGIPFDTDRTTIMYWMRS